MRIIAAIIAIIHYRRSNRPPVVRDAEAIVEAEARRASRDAHPSNWGRS